MKTGIYTTAPISVGRFGRENIRRERWRVHSLEPMPLSSSFYCGVREDTGGRVIVHEDGLEFDPEPILRGCDTNGTNLHGL